MALGVDTVFAHAVLELKQQGIDIKLHCAVPFKGQESRWPQSSITEYHNILNQADEVVIVCDGRYAADKMIKRDHFMVDHSDLVIGVWNGMPSGTGRCVLHAKRQAKAIIRLDPNEIRYNKEGDYHYE